MKALSGLTISVGLLLAAAAAHAQGTSPQDTGRSLYHPASDIDEPYADMPPPPRANVPPPHVVYGAPNYGPQTYGPPAYGPRGYGPQGYAPQAYGGPEYGPGYGGPPLLPAAEVYAVLRQNGFSPLGAPRLRGLFYSVSAIDRRGDDGHLVIDARDGRIVRFVPAEHFGGYGGGGYGGGGYGDGYYGGAPRPSYGPLEPMTKLDGTRLDGTQPRPPAALQPKIASRMPQSVPVPKAAPSRPVVEQPVAAKPAPAPVQQSAAVQAKPVDAPPPAVAAAPAEVKPAAPGIQPTLPMPKVQGLE